MKNHRKIIFCFCGCIIIVFLSLIAYLWHTSNVLKNSQDKIINEHIYHIATVDSIFNELKTAILSNDSVMIENAPLLFSQLQKDSVLLRRELLLSQEEESNLVELHIDKIDNDYSQIGLWAGILSIIFLIFGFFAIFKIEETKINAQNILDDVREQEQKVKNEIKELETQAIQVNNTYKDIKQGNEAVISDYRNSLEKIIANTKTHNTQAIEKIKRIDQLLVEVESKNKQYGTSIKQMNELMGRLEILFNRLNELTNNNDKTNHE